MLRLALPVLAENMLHVLVDYVDLWLTGQEIGGDAAIAAMSQVGYIMWLTFMLFAVVASGATAMTARFVGSGNLREAAHAANQALLIGGGLSLLFVLVGYLYLDEFISLLQLEAEAHALAVRRLAIMLPILPAIMCEEVGFASLRGAGDTVSGLVTMALVNMINIVVSVMLLKGVGFLPELGWDGLAIGAACGHGFGGLIVLILLLKGRAGLKLRPHLLKPHANLIRRLLRIGLPGGADAVLVVLCHLWFVAIINSLGDRAAAAHGIGVRIEALAYMPGAAFYHAAATMVGQFLGAGDQKRAGRSVLMACAVGGTLMAAAGVLFFVAAVPLASFFIGESDSDVVPLAAELLRITAIAQPFLAVLIILSGALRGAGDTRTNLAITMIGFLAIRIPLATYLTQTDFIVLDTFYVGGVYGAWYAMLLDNFVRCGLVTWRFFHGGWKRIEV